MVVGMSIQVPRMVRKVEIFTKTFLHSRCDNDSSVVSCFIRWSKRSSNGCFSLKRTQVFSNTSNGSNGSQRRNMEIIGFGRLCSSSSKFFLSLSPSLSSFFPSFSHSLHLFLSVSLSFCFLIILSIILPKTRAFLFPIIP